MISGLHCIDGFQALLRQSRQCQGQMAVFRRRFARQKPGYHRQNRLSVRSRQRCRRDQQDRRQIQSRAGLDGRGWRAVPVGGRQVRVCPQKRQRDRRHRPCLGRSCIQIQAHDFDLFASNDKGDGVIYAATSNGQVMAIQPVLKPGSVGELVLNVVTMESIAFAD